MFGISTDKNLTATHLVRYNELTTNKVAVLLVDQKRDKRDIVLRMHDDYLQRISERHDAPNTYSYFVVKRMNIAV